MNPNSSQQLDLVQPASFPEGGLSERVARTRPLRRRLTAAQELDVQRHLRTHAAPMSGTGNGLWNAVLVHGLVAAITGVALPDRTFRTYLQRWDLVPPRPLQLAYRSAPSAVKCWMSLDRPVIAAQAREAKAQLLWLDLHHLASLGTRFEGEHGDDHLLFLSDNRGHSEWTITAGFPRPEQVHGFLQQAMSKEGRRLHLLVRDQRLIDGPLMEALRETQGDKLLLIPMQLAAK